MSGTKVTILKESETAELLRLRGELDSAKKKFAECCRQITGAYGLINGEFTDCFKYVVTRGNRQ